LDQGASVGSWKTKPMSPVSLPAISMRPELGGIKPAIIRSTVDLPQPEGPSRETKSPRPTARSTPRTASVPLA
jgi:hypothetical protein